MDRKKFFSWAMQRIDKWSETDSKSVEWFKNFSKNLTITNIISTPIYSLDVKELKTFLVLKVMDMYSYKNSSKVGYSDVAKMLEGTNTRKYNINIEKMDIYFDILANRNALKEQCPWWNGIERSAEEMKEILEIKEILEMELFQKEWIPYLLLKDIQKTARISLGKFYEKYTAYAQKEYVDKEKREEEDNKYYKELADIYEECVYAVTLHEIFLEESFYDSIWGLEVILERIQVLGDEINQTMPKSMHEILERVNELGDKIEPQQIAPEFFESYKNYIEELEKLKFLSIIKIFRQEFQIGLAAEQQLLMIFESIYLDNVLGKKKTNEAMKKKARAFLGTESLEDLSRLLKKNKTRVKSYKKSKIYMDDIFEKLMKYKMDGEKININCLFLCMKRFLEELQKPKQKQLEEVLWRNQYPIALWIFIESDS